MDNPKHRKRLVRHIEALDNAYENIISVLEEDLDTVKKDGEEDKIALKDDKIKTYAEGIEKATKTANYLLAEIKIKEEELAEIDKVKEENVPETKDGGSKLTNRLE